MAPRWAAVALTWVVLAPACDEPTRMVAPQFAEPIPDVAEPLPAENHLDIPEVVIYRGRELPLPVPFAPVSVTDAELHGDTLALSVSYYGGCAKHSFAMVAILLPWDVYPPQIELHLLPEELNDPCGLRVEEQLFFDVSPVRPLYWQEYGSEGIVTLLICEEPGRCFTQRRYVIGPRPFG